MNEVIFEIDTTPGSPSNYYPLDLMVHRSPQYDWNGVNLLINPTVVNSGLEHSEDTRQIPFLTNGTTKYPFKTRGKEYQMALQGVTSVLIAGKEYPKYIFFVKALTSD